YVTSPPAAIAAAPTGYRSPRSYRQPAGVPPPRGQSQSAAHESFWRLPPEADRSVRIADRSPLCPPALNTMPSRPKHGTAPGAKWAPPGLAYATVSARAMKLLSRVVWSEGMYLGPHHFQVQSRYFEDSIQFATSSLWFSAYGLAGVDLDAHALENGTVSVLHVCRVFP